MKGQEKIIEEILLFGIGIAVASYIMVSFGDLRTAVHDTTVSDDFKVMSNFLVSSLIKVSENNNSVIRVSIPAKLSDNNYRISLENNTLTVSSFENPSIKVSQQLFNISEQITLSYVLSSAKSLEIANMDGKIKIRRF